MGPNQVITLSTKYTNKHNFMIKAYIATLTVCTATCGYDVDWSECLTALVRSVVYSGSYTLVLIYIYHGVSLM